LQKATRHMERGTTPTSHSTRLHRKLKKDAIVEALWEVRFEAAESTQVPELVVAKLAGHSRWSHFRKVRLPLSDVPATLRQQDPTLRSQATLELRQPEGSRVVKIGSNVLSYHVLAPYCGGEQFTGEINEAIDFVFAAIENFKATRFGLRYINAMNETDHHIKNVTDLSLRISVSGEILTSPVNLAYRNVRGPNHWSMVRIASPEFVTGSANIPMNALVDVDLLTPPEFESDDASMARDWVNEAKKYELEDFWRLIPKQIQDEIVEEWVA
jgi:uncharacterized protein (TIGR04255 family)